MGETIDEAMVHAEESLRNYAIEARKDDAELTMPSPIEGVEVPAGNTLVSIPMIRSSGRSVRANLSRRRCCRVHRRRGMTRKAYVEWMARRIAQMGGQAPVHHSLLSATPADWRWR